MRTHRTSTLCLLAATCLLLASSCATKIPVGTDFNPASEDHVVVVSLPFVTNRKLNATRSGSEYFSDVHGTLSAGRCRVAFGENDRRGEILRVDSATVGSVLPHARDGRVVIYVHGYGESFARNCRRAALLKHHLQLENRLLLFSWPASNYLTYAQDARDLEQSLDDLNEVLTLITESVGHEHVVIMAHSMGSRGVVDAVKLRVDDPASFSEVIFVAPDIRRDVFLENIYMLQEKFSDITVYMSDNDRVLWLSTTVNVSGRLGVAKEFDIDADHISVIDITPTGSNDISGHLYHMFNPAVTEDLRVLFGVVPPDSERSFQRVRSETPGFWKLEPVPSGQQ